MERVELTAYRTYAKPLTVRFDDHVLNVAPKTFSTGSVGWYASQKLKLLVGDTYYNVQVAVTLTVIGSKFSHGQEGPYEAQEGPLPLLEDPPMPWNRSEPEGPILGQETAPGDPTTNGSMPKKAPKPKRKQASRHKAD